jgi:hypothetical protein
MANPAPDARPLSGAEEVAFDATLDAWVREGLPAWGKDCQRERQTLTAWYSADRHAFLEACDATGTLKRHITGCMRWWHASLRPHDWYSATIIIYSGPGNVESQEQLFVHEVAHFIGWCSADRPDSDHSNDRIWWDHDSVLANAWRTIKADGIHVGP